MAVTRPIPVITTRGRISARLPAQLDLNELHRIFDAPDLDFDVFSLLLQSKLVFDHNEGFNDRQRVQTEVFDESSVVRDSVDSDTCDSTDGLFDPESDFLCAHVCLKIV